MTTFAEVLAVSEPLKPGQVAQLLGYRSPINQVGHLRASGRTVSTQRLVSMATQLRAIAAAIEQLPTPT